MKRIILTFLLTGGMVSFFAGCNSEQGKQEDVLTKAADSDKLYVKVETMPQFPGGDEALMTFVSQTVKYPKEALGEGTEGRVVTSFVVNKDGSVSDIEIMKGVDPLLDEEAIRVVKEMPRWTPGEEKGEKVRVKFTLPIVFQLPATGQKSKTAREGETHQEGEIYTVTDIMPQYPGGDNALLKYIGSSVKYPQEAIEKGIQGRVVVTYTVNVDGSISDAKVVRGIDPQLDAEALRVINLMPNWIPGEHEGKKVRVRYTLPVVFRLQ